MQVIALCLLIVSTAVSEASFCHDYAVNNCNKDQGGELFAIIAESRLNCQQYCEITVGCQFYAYYEVPIMNLNCHLFEEPFHVYLDHCDVHSGPLKQNTQTECFDPLENSCEVEQYEDCVLYGTVLERDLAAPEMSVCEEFCRLNQGEGCRYWEWNREKETCDLFDSVEKSCHIEFGPKNLPPDECWSLETPTPTLPTTTQSSSTATYSSSTGVTTVTTTTSSSTGPSYLYLDDTTILNMNTLEIITCQQDFPGHLEPAYAQGAVVPYDDGDSLMICGGTHRSGCLVWQESGWQDVDTSFFKERWLAASASMPGNNGDWLVYGGRSFSVYLDSAVLYSNGVWSLHSSLPVSVANHCMVSVSGRVFVIGGWTGQNFLSDVYELAGGVWTKHSSLTTPRYDHVCAVLGDDVVVVGGYSEGDYLGSVEVLPSGSDTWVTGPSLPAMSFAQAVAYQDSLYVLGGRKGSAINDNIYRLDSVSDHWITEEKEFTQRNKYVFPAPLLYEHQLYCK